MQVLFLFSPKTSDLITDSVSRLQSFNPKSYDWTKKGERTPSDLLAQMAFVTEPHHERHHVVVVDTEAFPKDAPIKFYEKLRTANASFRYPLIIIDTGKTPELVAEIKAKAETSADNVQILSTPDKKELSEAILTATGRTGIISAFDGRMQMELRTGGITWDNSHPMYLSENCARIAEDLIRSPDGRPMEGIRAKFQSASGMFVRQLSEKTSTLTHGELACSTAGDHLRFSPTKPTGEVKTERPPAPTGI